MQYPQNIPCEHVRVATATITVCPQVKPGPVLRSPDHLQAAPTPRYPAALQPHRLQPEPKTDEPPFAPSFCKPRLELSRLELRWLPRRPLGPPALTASHLPCSAPPVPPHPSHPPRPPICRLAEFARPNLVAAGQLASGSQSAAVRRCRLAPASRAARRPPDGYGKAFIVPNSTL